MIKGLLNWWRRREREAMRAVYAQGWREAWDEELVRFQRARHPHNGATILEEDDAVKYVVEMIDGYRSAQRKGVSYDT